LVITNAAGSCNPSFAPGDLMRITDHLNFTPAIRWPAPTRSASGPGFQT